MKSLKIKLVFLFLSGVAIANTTPDKIIDEQKKSIVMNQNSQKIIDELYDDRNDLLSEYRLVLEETENLRIYNEQLKKVIQSQEEDAKSIEKQIKSIETTNKKVVPLMIKMLEGLETFVALDIPFLKSERDKRVASLKEMFDRADVSTSEKYRRIMEAYQIEAEYGRTIEAYTENVVVGDREISVEFLRLGRVALMFRSLDGSLARYWNQSSRSWKDLDSKYLDQISDGVKIAKKLKAPDLITLPLQTPEGK